MYPPIVRILIINDISHLHKIQILVGTFLTKTSMFYQTVEKPKKPKPTKDDDQSTDEETGEESEGEAEPSDTEEPPPEDDEEDWLKFQEEAKKENVLETKSKETHPVHCPYFPGVSL